MHKLKIIGALTGIILSVIVILQNTQPVTSRILFFSVTMPSAVLTGLALLVGLAAGLLLALPLSSGRDTRKSASKSSN